MSKFLYILAVFLCAGCGHEAGDCVLVSPNSWVSQKPEKGVYLKFDDGSHWYTVDDETKSILGSISNITSCEE